MIRYIIDGHNLIHTVPAYLNLLDRSYTRALQTVYKDVDTYIHSKNVKAVLVFDGNPPWEPPEETGGLSVIFSGDDRDADSVINQRARKWQGPQTVVVSGDSHIKQTAMSLGCQTAPPKDFYRLIRSRNRDRSPRRKEPRGKSEASLPTRLNPGKRR